jgi:SSS family solute:Na+ symporter
MAKWVSLIVKFGALVFIVFVPTAIRDPAAAARRHLDHPDAAVGDARRLHALVQRLGAADRLGGRHRRRHGDGVRGRILRIDLPLSVGGYTLPGYTAFYTVILNLVVAIVLTPVFNAMSGKRGSTRPSRRLPA